MLLIAWPTAADQTNAPPAAQSPVQESDSQATLRALAQLEAQQRATQAAIEQNGREAKTAAASNAEAVTRGLQKFEEALAAEQEAFSVRSARELEAMRSANHATLLLGGALVGIASLAMLVIAWFQWRMNRAWSRMAASLPGELRLSNGSALADPALEDSNFAAGPVAESNRRLFGAIETLERRIAQLEERTTSGAPSGQPALPSADSVQTRVSADNAGGNGDSEPAPGENHVRVASLLAEAKSLLKENQLEGAVARLDEVLLLEPNNGEALVKKGAALERLQKLNEAIDCYDRAIAAGGLLTLAYLHKGGLFNRLERFKEALQCYEQALRSHEDGAG